MDIDLADAVKTDAPLDLLWQRMLDASAVFNLLGGTAEAIRPLQSPAASDASGHSFRIKGAGGGNYHARIDERVEGVMVSYVVWSEHTPKSPVLLTYAIDTSGEQTELSGNITMDMPLEEVLASFSLAGLFAMPLVGGLMQRYVAHRLRTQLVSMAAAEERTQSAR